MTRDTIHVLDHGHVRLVNHMGDDLAIVRAARVSYNAAWRTGEDAGKDEKLLRYLLANGHTSPFEHVTFTFDVKAPIFVLRQWHRHRTQSYNELSARYTELADEFYVPDVAHIGRQSDSSKQARHLDVHLTSSELAQREIEVARYRAMCEDAFGEYRAFLDAGWPRELARLVLPVSTYSQMFATVNLHNLFRFLGERLHPHAQYEIRFYALAMLELVRTVAPVAVGIWEERYYATQEATS